MNIHRRAIRPALDSVFTHTHMRVERYQIRKLQAEIFLLSLNQLSTLQDIVIVFLNISLQLSEQIQSQWLSINLSVHEVTQNGRMRR